MLLLCLIVVLAVTSSVASPPQTPLPQLPPGVIIRNVKFTTFTNVSSAGSVAGAPGSNPNRLALPTDASAVKIERTELHVYSMELSNDGPKAIKALAWDFMFAEPMTFTVVLRHSFANLQNIDSHQKKTVRFTTHLGQPMIVDASKANDPSWDYQQYAQLQCVLFTDGSTWEHEVSGKPCERLRKWIELRKKSQTGVEDLPFNP